VSFTKALPVLALAALPALSHAQSLGDENPPATLASEARIAPESEPGEPLVITGTVFDGSGRKPVPGVVVFAYQTDAKGLYTPSGAARPPRLRGWARTDADGRYTFNTIKPGPYPGGGVPAHVHFVLSGAGHPRQEAEELRFEGGEYVTAEIAEASRRAGRFGGVRPLVKGGDGVWRCMFDLRRRE
jgi:protocatechuate 3,4-dioxygenase beta subunit